MQTLCRDCRRRAPAGADACAVCGSVRVLRHAELHHLAIAHLDCDAFYATIEKRDRPELRDVPVIVGGRHRGVVTALQKRLARDGIATVGDLAYLDEAALVARYGRIGRRLWLCARGADDRPVDPDRKAKSVSSEITLDEDLSDADRLRPILWQLAETVSRRMKKAGIAGRGETLKLKTAGFRMVTRRRRLGGATQSADEMFRAAKPLLVREADGRAFRLIGIGMHDLVEAGDSDDFLGQLAPGEGKIDRAMDAARDRFGEDAIVKGRGFGTKLMRQGPSKVE